MEQNRKQRSDAIMKVVPMEPLREGFVGRMALRGKSSDVALKDVTNMS